MQLCIPPDLCVHLGELGKALDSNRLVSVFSDGFVGLDDKCESEVNAYAQGNRSGARPRSRQRASRRQRWGASGQTGTFRSRAIEEAYGAGFRVLAQNYASLAFEDENGLWVAVASRPLGIRGPQVHFLVAFPLNQKFAPRGWAFNHVGPRASAMSLKHTNFPDASVCAFTTASNAWTYADGIIGLIDHFSTWVIKSWHRELYGTWPGPQFGAGALYRRREFAATEWCGCESGKRYRDCHMGIDFMTEEQSAQKEFLRLFSIPYEQRAVPDVVMKAAESSWREIPSFDAVFRIRHAGGEPTWGAL